MWALWAFQLRVFPDIVKDEMDNRAVKTNITLPAWLKELAEMQGVNFSQITQAALKNILRWKNNNDDKAHSRLYVNFVFPTPTHFMSESLSPGEVQIPLQEIIFPEKQIEEKYFFSEKDPDTIIPE